MSPKRVNKYLTTRILGREILHFPVCDSTNCVAKNVPQNHGTVVIADRQTAGRGRLGHEWQSEKGGIYMSVIITPKKAENVTEITLICAVAVRRALGVGEIKWPNDIVIDQKKVCGILCERTANAVICGIGINVNNAVSADIPATRLKGTDPSKITAAILNNLEQLSDEDFANIRREYENHCINVGNCVKAIFHNRTVTGTAKGVTDTGELIIDTPDGEICVNSGEVSVRGIYGYI